MNLKKTPFSLIRLYTAKRSIVKTTFLAVCFTALTCMLNAQTTESLAVKEMAPGSTDWMREPAKADDYREPKDEKPIDSKPYSEVNDGRTPVPGPVYHQPAGELSGKIVYAMAGHGWTYDADEMYYYTQRGLSNGMVEDLGNADQMHIFAHLAFNSGATIVPFRPIDHQPNERIIDNDMNQVEYFGKWRAGKSDKYQGSPNDTIPYAVADADLLESAVARYRPYIPESGYYPVYVWARDGADRSNQLYRVVHAGGEANVRVNWKRTGKAWVWLGTYYFNQGDKGYVEISNQVLDPYEAYNGHVVVADAVRFGNGMGDVPRPGGISGFSREDEGDSYWIQRSVGMNANRHIYDAGKDGNSTVSSPPKAAAHANRETEGSFWDRILISFHSNASTGKARGAIALFNANPNKRPTFQESLAEILGAEVNAEMRNEDTPDNEEWSDRQRNTYSGINFGELRRDYIQNEMCATIAEVAFHDNKEDAEFLLDPASRIHMAQAVLRGIFRWYAEIVQPNSSYTLMPSRPSAVAATVDDGRIKVKWKAGPENRFDGGPAEKIQVYRSTDGYGFDGGIDVDAKAEDFTVDALTSVGVTFLRVTASNAAGESFPSQTIAVGLNEDSKSKGVKSLHIAVNTKLDHTTNVPYDLGTQPGGPYKESARTQRVRAVYNLLEPSGVAEALALSTNGQSFDGADLTAYENGLIDRDNYKRIFVTAEAQNPVTPLLSEKAENYLRDFLVGNGKLYVSGDGLAANLYNHGGKHRNFLENVLGATGSETQTAVGSLHSTDNRFFSTTRTISLVSNPRSWGAGERYHPASFSPKKGRTISLLKFTEAGDKIGGILTRPSYSRGEVVFLGFPLSQVKGSSVRDDLMKAILKQM